MTVDRIPREISLENVTDTVVEQVRRVLPPGLDCPITLDSSLHDIGLDSLARMNVLNDLEEAFGVRFSEESLYDMESCRDMIEFIQAKLVPGCFPRSNMLPPASPPPAPTKAPGIARQHWDVREFPECIALQERFISTAAAGLTNPFFRSKQQIDGALATIDGREVVSYTSFDYLGLAGHPRVIGAAKNALDRFGASASASRLVGGNHAIVQQLDEELARFLGTEAAMVFPSGYGTNASLFGHLFNSKDLILYDELAHNSIVQGASVQRPTATFSAQ